MTVITLLSDFGLTDPYVAQMKAVILRNKRDVEIVDISHGIERHNIAMGSFILETTAPFFPEGTIHVAVIDPGVGSQRLPLVLACNRAVLVGPDNGLLTRAADKLGFQAGYRIQNRNFTRAQVSSTFHGRDIFAQTAGKIAAGLKPRDVGPRVSRLVKLELDKARVSRGVVSCNVLYVDVFGNVIVDVGEKAVKESGLHVGQRVKIRTSRAIHYGLFVKAYSSVERGQLAVLWGSQGYLEIAMREGNAAKRLGVKVLERLELSFRESYHC